MAQRTCGGFRRAIELARWPRYIAAVVALGLVLVACSVGSTGGPTSTPSATATPVPCTTWRIVPSPNATDFKGNVLSGVSASSPTDAWAVGESVPADLSGAPPGQQTLIERWDGTAWRLVTGPSADYLHDVAVVSPTDVWAVGGVFNYGVGYHPYKPLIEHWNGTQWAVVPGPDTHANAVELDSVAALAPDDVWAVGPMDFGAQHVIMPLVERWDGASWQIIDNPTPAGATETRLNAVATIPGTKQVWAVGSWHGLADNGQTLIERWDGTAWQTVPNPSLPSGALWGSLNGVAALSASDAWAVGNYTASNHTIRTLIAHWDGATWGTVSSPDTGGTLSSVAAAAAHDVRAVGRSFAGDVNTQAALIEQWDGTVWRVVTSVAPNGAGSSGLNDVSADSRGNFWAVGSFGDAVSTVQTLIARCP